MEYLYHVNPGKDGSLNPSMWVAITAEDKKQAVQTALGRELSARPSVIYVSVGTARHANGAPVCVCRYGLKWGR